MGSSIGDLLRTVALNGAVKAPKAMGLGMGGTTLRSVFGTGKVKVKNSVAAVHGLVNEYTKACKTVRANWPMGLGKYLMDRLETPCSPRVCSRSTRSLARMATMFTSMAALLVCPTS